MTDFQHAAKKNLTDASILFEKKRYDGAGYLSGYVIECVFKTVIQVENNRPFAENKVKSRIIW